MISTTTNNLLGLTAHEGQLIAVGFGAGTIVSSGNGVDWIKSPNRVRFITKILFVIGLTFLLQLDLPSK